MQNHSAPASSRRVFVALVVVLAGLPIAAASSAAAQFANIETTVARCSSECFGVAVDTNGNVYIADTFSDRVLKETPSPTGYTQSVVGTGFNKPYGVAVDQNGNVYVADTYNNRIVMEKLSAGVYIPEVIAAARNAWNVAVDNSGNFYTVSGNPGAGIPPELIEWTPSSGSTYTPTVIADAANGLDIPWEVAVDSGGRVYVTDAGTNSVYMETPTGGSYSQSTVATGLDFPAGIAVDAKDNVYIANAYQKQILMESPSADGGYTQSVYETGPLPFPYELAADRQGDLYIANPQALDVLKETPETSTTTSVYIQIQGPEGSVYGFRASSTGKLSAIPGSPFKPAGETVGSTPTRFFTLGKTLIHSYGIAPDGAIESPTAQIPIFDYAGSGCGDDTTGANGAVLDHTGEYVYVLLEDGGDWSCSAYQSYKINSDGSFIFIGDTEENWGNQIGQPDPSSVGLPSILGNEGFAYADESAGHQSSTIAFQREYSGLLQVMPMFAETDPVLANGYYVPYFPDASPSGNYVVVQLYPNDGSPPQLGSYTADFAGNISTTNTSSNMPTSAYPEFKTTFSPSADFFVAYEDGIEIYRFNGASPLTHYQTLLKGTRIDDVKWDRAHHLFAISYAENKLYVFTVTPTSVTEDSSWSIGSPFKMVVVSK